MSVKQYGGTHYESEYQHWDLVTDIGMGYLPGNATKYVARWRKKNGVADLHKAMTYIDKMLAVLRVTPDYKFNRDPSYKTSVYVERFVEINGLVNHERSIIELLSGPCPIEMLVLVHDHLQTLIATAQRAQEAGLPLAAPTPTPAPSMGPAAAKTGGPGRAGRATTQAPASSASTGVHRKGLDGMEHPFGYDDWHEGGPT